MAEEPQSLSSGRREKDKGALRRLLSAIRSRRGVGRRLSAVGQGWLLTTVLLLGIGLFKNINLLALLGYVMLVLLALNVVVAGRRMHQLRAYLAWGEPVFAEAPSTVEVLADNAAGRPCLAVRVEASFSAGAPTLLAWFVERWEGQVRRALRGTIVFARRGRYPCGPVLARSGHPFGLATRTVVLEAAGDVIVLPRLGRLHRGLLRRYLRSAEARELRTRVRRMGWCHPAAQDELHGLRSYRSGDSLRAIHWRTSARRGELMVREFEALPGDDLLLVIDPSGGADGHFESAISLAATICWEWCQRRGDQLILAVAGLDGPVLTGLTDPAHAQRLLECLAVLQPGPATDAPALFARVGNDRLRGRVAVLLVSAGPSRLGGPLRQRLRHVACLDASALSALDFYEPPAKAHPEK
jgi:uncharacterized protein (DUF58 family)